jgi:hypothetical protein
VTFCRVASDPVGATAESIDQNCTLTAGGTYTNIVCGTGMAPGQGTLASADGSIFVPYMLNFVAGVGVLTSMGAVETDAAMPNDPGGGVSYPAIVVGLVVIISDATPPCPTAGFQYAAVLTAVEIPTNPLVK